MPEPSPRDQEVSYIAGVHSSSKVTQEGKDRVQRPGKLRRFTPLPFTSLSLIRAPELNGAPPDAPFPHLRPGPRTLPALPLILQPAVIVWARIHLQYQLHGEPCPARGLRGSRAALSCPGEG